MSSFKQDFEHSFKVIKSLEERLDSPNSLSVHDELANLVYTLDSPLFSQLVNLQDALLQLRALSLQRRLSATKFDFDRKSGRLVVYPQEEELNVGAVWSEGVDPALWKRLEPLVEGRAVETVVLEKGDGASLGFGVVGLRCEERGELGIFVQEIQPGGVAARSGLLRRNDQVLAVNGCVFERGVTRDQAVRILQQVTGNIELVVARGPPPPPPPPPSPPPPLTLSDGDRVPGRKVPTTGGDKGPDYEHSTDGLDMVLSTEWTQLEVINLVNDGSGLGFGIIGGKSTGVVVKTILPGGISDRDGRLHSGDHLIQIGEINVRGMGSEQVASVLRQSGAHVRLLVARGIVEPSPIFPPYAPIIPTQQLSEHINQLNALMSGYQGYGGSGDADPSAMAAANLMGDELLPAEIHPPPLDARSPGLDLGPEVEIFCVELVKDAIGLGITVVGYVSTSVTDEGLSGIFVRSISDGSTAALDGRIQVNDQIIAVDDQLLEGFTNQESVDILRNTGQVVRLKLARYKYGRKHDLLTRSIAQAAECDGAFEVGIKPLVDESVYIVDYEDYSGDLRKEKEDLIASKWRRIVGDNFDIIVAQVSKFKEGGGLGISLEGTVDVENGVELHPHHYIRSVVSDGPVGRNGRLQSGDELLEVNRIQLFGLNHVEVVTILKDLPQHVRLVCARRRPTLLLDPNDYLCAPVRDQFFQIPSPPPSDPPNMSLEFPIFGDRLVKAKSEQALPVAEDLPEDVLAFSRLKSRSLEPLTGLAMWGNDVVELELEKGDRGLGFSILDYQDPINPVETVIVIRSLVPGGVAQLDGRLVPGDRLLYVNDTNLEHATLKQAVTALKGAALGRVVLGVAKPLPLPDVGDSSWEDLTVDSRYALGQSSIFCGRLEPAYETSANPSSSSGRLSWNEVSLEHGSVRPWAAGNENFDSRHLAPKTNFAQPDMTSSLAAATRPPGVDFFNHSTINSRLKDTLDSPGSSSTLSHEMAPSTLTFDSEGSATKANSSSIRSESVASKSSGEGGVSTESLVSSGVLSTSSGAKPEVAPKPKFIIGGKVVLTPARNALATEVRPVGSAMQLSISSSPQPTVTTEIQPSGTSLLSPSLKRDLSSTPVPSPPNRTEQRWQNSFGRSKEEILPSSLERTIKIQKASGSMGIVVEPTANNGANGCVVKVIVANEAVAMDGRIQVGDVIVAINNETLRRATNAQARAILRRASLLATDISITYIPTSTLTQHLMTSCDWKGSLPETTEERGSDHSGVGGSTNFCPSHFNQRLPSSPSSALPVEGGGCLDDAVAMAVATTTVTSVTADQLKLANTSQSVARTSQSVMTTPSRSVAVARRDSSHPVVPMVTHPAARQQDVAMTTAPAIQDLISCGDARERLTGAYGFLEGEVHLVVIDRGHGVTSLGLCLAGNRDPSRMSSFVAGILPDSPVARDGRVRVGDLLIQVNERVLFGRSHLQASAIINSVSADQLSFVLLRHHNFRQQMATVVSLKLPPVQHKDDPTTCICKWPTSRSTVSRSEATEMCLTNGLPNVTKVVTVTHDLSVTHDSSLNSSVADVGRKCSHGDENQVNGNWVSNETGQERLSKLGQGKEEGIGGQDEGQTRNVEGQGVVREGQNETDEGHELVQKGQQPDNRGQYEVKEDKCRSEAKENRGRAEEVQSEANEVQEQAKELKEHDEIGRNSALLEKQEKQKEKNREQDKTTLEEDRNTQEEDKKAMVQNKDNKNGEGQGQDSDQNKGGHKKNKEAEEQGKEVQVKDKEEPGKETKAQEMDIDGQEQNKEGLGSNKEGQELHKEVPAQSDDSQSHDKEGQSQDKEEQEPNKELLKKDTEEQVGNAQSEEGTSKNKELIETGAGRGVDLNLAVMMLEDLVIDQEKREELVDRPSVEDALGEKVKCQVRSARVRCQGQFQCGNSVSSAEDDSVTKTTPVERDRKRMNRTKATESHQPLTAAGGDPLSPRVEGEVTASSTPSSVREDPATCSIIAGRETTVQIDKGRLALGVDVIGGINTLLGVILINEIYENGAAAMDGRLAIGDQIIEVNGELFHDVTDELANEILRQTPPCVRMVVYREETPLREDEIYDLFSVDLLKKPGKGLGFSIIGRHRDNGIFVSDVIKGGVADLDGQLMPGDQILVINGTDVRHVSQQFAAEMLKTLIGRVSLTVGRVKCLSRSTSRSSSSLSEVDSDEEAAALASAQKRDQVKDKVKEKVTR